MQVPAPFEYERAGSVAEAITLLDRYGDTARLVAGDFLLRKVDVLRVKGKREPMALYELLGEKTDPAAARLGALAQAYDAAFEAYQGQRFDAAEKVLLEVFETFGEDGPSKALRARIAVFRSRPPGLGWDGVFDSTEK